MAEWVDAVNRTWSWQYKCSACGKVALYNHGKNSKTGKTGERPKCGYKFCPYCGRRMRNAEGVNYGRT